MTDWGASGRTDTYRFFTVDPFSLVRTGEFEAIPSECSITYGYETDNKRQADLTIITPYDDIRGQLLQVEHTCTVGDDTVTEVLGTFFALRSPTDVGYGLTRTNLNCYSTLYRHTQDYLPNDFVRAAGYSNVQFIRDLVEAGGGTLSVASDVTDRNLSVQQVCPMTDDHSIATWMNTAAGWMGGQIDVADTGEVVLQKYYRPSEKGVVYEFAEGANCVYVSGYQLSDTTADCINRVVAYCTTPTTTRRACVDLPDSDPYSYRSIGMHKTARLAITEDVTQQRLLANATDYLNARRGSSTRIEFEHVGIPGLRAGQVVRYTNSNDGDPIDGLAIIEQMSFRLTPGMMTTTKVRLI